MTKDLQPIIIKKIIKKEHAAHHGGAWKVAYADFVTAMMALFMVLWLVAVMSVDAKAALAEYFRSHSIFDGTVGTGSGISVMQGDIIKLDPSPGDSKQGNAFKESLQITLTGLLNNELEGLDDQVLVIVTKEGIRIELVEKYGKPMFKAAEAELLQDGRDILGILALALREKGIRVAIEGHTDSSGYYEDDYTNWELAADRANAARRALLDGGLKEDQIVKVTSFADSNLLKEENPADPMNRRVSLLLMLDE